MRRIGDLWVWIDHKTQRLMLGNKAAAQAICDAPPAPSPPLPALERPGQEFCDLGNYALTGGPALRLWVKLDPVLERDMDSLTGLLAPLRSRQSASMELHYSASPEGRYLWRNDELIAHGPLKGQGECHDFNLIFEILRHLLSHRDLVAIVHGSALRWQGRNLVFTGRSGAGKSTLSALLAARGGQYLGDDNVALMAPGCAIAPLPLSPTVKQGAWPVLAPHYPALSSAPVYHKGSLPFRFLPDAPFDPRPDVGPPDLLIFPRFSRSESPKATPLSPVETLFGLSHAGLWFSPDDAERLIDLACTCPAIALRHGTDLAASESLLNEVLNSA